MYLVGFTIETVDIT